MEPKNICPICLRINRKLKVISSTLLEYHNELTNYTLSFKNLEFCSDCEYLLRKTYSFQQKCVDAANILKNWINATTKDKTPANLLHLELPPISIDKWTPQNNKVFTYTYTDSIQTSTFVEECVCNKLCTGSLKGTNMLDTPNIEDIKQENVESIVDDRILFKNELKHEHYQITGVLDNSLQNDNNNSEDTANVFQNNLIQENNNDNSSRNTEILEKINTKCNKINRPSKKTIDKTKHGNIKTRTAKDKMQRKVRKPYIDIDIDVKKYRNNLSNKPKLKHNKNRINDTEEIDLEIMNLGKEYLKNGIIVKDENNKHPAEDQLDLYCPKERLKTRLKNWKELKSDDGFIFDKDTIINSLDLVPDRVIKRLSNFMHDTSQLDSSAVKILKMIQDKQQFTIQYESVFDIEYLLTEKEKIEEFERRKTYDCYVKAEYKCELCYQGFKGEGYLEYHKKTHDESQGQFSCRICHMRQHSKQRHRSHMLSHSVVYKCKLCPLVTYYKDSMINHYEQHKGTVYECDKCHKTYKSKSMLNSHQSHAHSSGGHVCTICGGAYSSQNGLITHTSKKHRGVSPTPADGSGYSCEECTLTFPSEEACVRHRKVTHGVRVKSPATKRKHRVLGKPRRKPIMTCPECKAVGHSYGWMVKHFDIEHPLLDVSAVYADRQIYLCDICGKGFTQKGNLGEHIRFRHTGVKFPCPSCGKQFGTLEKLRQHRVRHEPPAHCCERCGKKFHAYSNLCNHMRIHIGDRCFKCDICGKGFLHRATLREHIRGVHNHERRVRRRGGDCTSRGAVEALQDVTEPSN